MIAVIILSPPCLEWLVGRFISPNWSIYLFRADDNDYWPKITFPYHELVLIFVLIRRWTSRRSRLINNHLGGISLFRCWIDSSPVWQSISNVKLQHAWPKFQNMQSILQSLPQRTGSVNCNDSSSSSTAGLSCQPVKVVYSRSSLWLTGYRVIHFGYRIWFTYNFIHHICIIKLERSHIKIYEHRSFLFY